MEPTQPASVHPPPPPHSVRQQQPITATKALHVLGLPIAIQHPPIRTAFEYGQAFPADYQQEECMAEGEGEGEFQTHTADED